MKISIVRANSFKIDPDKKYLILITNKDNLLSQADLDDINRRLNASFNGNITVTSLPAGTKYKVLEAEDKAA